MMLRKRPQLQTILNHVTVLCRRLFFALRAMLYVTHIYFYNVPQPTAVRDTLVAQKARRGEARKGAPTDLVKRPPL